MEYVRGRGRNKCFWTKEETIVLIQVLQDIARDPSWTWPGGFKSNYMYEVHRRMVRKMPTFTKQPSPHIESKVKWLKTKFFVINDMVKHIGCQWNEVEKKIICEREWYESYCRTHKEAKGLWDFRFPYYDQLALVYRRGLAPNAAVEARGDYINNMEVVVLESKMESGSEDLGESDDSYSGDEENGVHLASQPSPTALNNDANETPVATKRNATPDIEDGVAKRSKTTPLPLDIGSRLDEINTSFQAFVEGFNANFATMTKFMTNDNIRQRSDSEKLKDVIDELMKLSLSSDDVFKAAEIFATNKNKTDVFISLPEKLRVSYVIKAFNANFESITNAVTNAATEDNAREKMASEKLKEVIVEIMKLNLTNEDIFKAADMFAAERNRIDVFFGLPEELQAAYVSRLTGS
ncbi:Myb/SANT-like domain-containing protein [Tanacetum coccineum]